MSVHVCLFGCVVLIDLTEVVKRSFLKKTSMHSRNSIIIQSTFPIETQTWNGLGGGTLSRPLSRLGLERKGPSNPDWWSSLGEWQGSCIPVDNLEPFSGFLHYWLCYLSEQFGCIRSSMLVNTTSMLGSPSENWNHFIWGVLAWGYCYMLQLEAEVSIVVFNWLKYVYSSLSPRHKAQLTGNN